ncbi:MAG: 4Fe-4S ferredoxin [Verrucomicrobiia bacterium]|jgi:electron-transferring-flavoprotein dehydrogenase
MENRSSQDQSMKHPRMDVDIVCVGFGPATAGFLTTLSRKLTKPDGTPAFESRCMPGMPLQVVCYERADDVGFGVSGVVSRARSIKQSFNESELATIPMFCKVKEEKLLYLLDPHGASRRPFSIRAADKTIRALKFAFPYSNEAVELPYIPKFLHKQDGFVFSIGQFMQWVAANVQSSGSIQIWPGTPASEVIIEDNSVKGIRLIDQGVEKSGKPTAGYTPGMEIRAQLTVVGDGPVGVIGRKIDEHFGLPPGNERADWAVGMKIVVDLPDNTPLQPGDVFHTFGYPEPEIFGFMYVYPDKIASLGIFVPSWFNNPIRTAYRYLQYWILHPYLWQYLNGAKLRSWGAKSILESGKRGAPYLVGNGYARIGEGSGSTNVLTNSGVDEAWETGKLLAEAVIQLLEKNLPFTKENLDATYVKLRSQSWVEQEGRIAEKARDGFNRGIASGLIGMMLSGLTNGKINLTAKPKPASQRIPTVQEFFKNKFSQEEIKRIMDECASKRLPLNSMLMEKAGWQPIPYDGKLLVSHQDILLLGGKVQAPEGYADHVSFANPELCKQCDRKICIEMCSAQAIAPGENGTPSFDREKCIHCGACLWNCVIESPGQLRKTNIEFAAGTGGLHSAEN